MMVLLCVIYLSFISLGLPDSLLGAAWPMMRVELQAPLPMAGMVSMLCSGCTIVSSLMSSRLIRRFGTGKVTMVSTALTAAALTGYACAPVPWVLFLAAIPLGMGAGCVDAALNNYVALHYKARHMSWLHCFWGLGATGGSMILSLCIGAGWGWRTGYMVCIVIQTLLVLVLIVTLPLWKQASVRDTRQSMPTTQLLTNKQAFHLPGVKAVMLVFFCYCAAEASMMLWTASYAEHRGATHDQAAMMASLFIGSLTIGRGLTGFLTSVLSSKALIRLGASMMLAGTVILLLPLGLGGCIAGVLCVGAGCAPIYPCNIHEAPHRFGIAASQAATGLQMAMASTGATLMPPLFGSLFSQWNMSFLPWWVLLLTGMMLACSEVVNRRTEKM